MTTKTVNRISKKSKHQCSWRGCGLWFKTPQGLAMHVGRTHTKTILNGGSKQSKAKIHVDGSLSGRAEPAKRKYTKRAASWNAAPLQPATNRIANLSANELYRVSKLYLRASALRRKFEQVLAG